jgi:fused signal recognition particle receptor
MFGFLKEKIKSWFKKSKEEIEEKQYKEKDFKKEQEKISKPIEQVEQEVEKEIKKKQNKPKLEQLKKETKKDLKVFQKEQNDKLEEIQQEIKKVEEKKEIKPLPQEPIIEEKKKPGFFKRLFGTKTILIDKEQFNSFWDNLEIILLENNVALEAVDAIKSTLEKELINKEINKDALEKEMQSALRKAIEQLLVEPFDLLKLVKSKSPYIILFFGINGSGKTTTIAKLAYLLKQKGISSILAAGDTFRAASMEQLGKHAERLSIKMISQTYGADPAAVAFDAISYAKTHNIQAVLIDTAGRMHTKENLLNEMSKIVRVTKPDLKIFLGESITGNDATEQAKAFNDLIGIDGIILSKADIDEKGGTAISVSYITGKPILFLGTGQEYKDLIPFSKDKLIESLGL